MTGSQRHRNAVIFLWHLSCRHGKMFEKGIFFVALPMHEKTSGREAAEKEDL